MGFRVSWLAVQGSKQRLLDALNLVDTGISDEANQAPLSAAKLPTGWTVLWSDDEGYAGDALGRLPSAGGPVLAVQVNETCMHSTATLFDGTERVWRLHHEGDERIDFLHAEGALPPEAAAIEADLRARQAEEDAGRAEVDFLFDIPLEVAKAVCGFKHDEMLPPDEAAFTEVRKKVSPVRPWWSSLLGQR